MVIFKAIERDANGDPNRRFPGLESWGTGGVGSPSAPSIPSIPSLTVEMVRDASVAFGTGCSNSRASAIVLTVPSRLLDSRIVFNTCTDSI